MQSFLEYFTELSQESLIVAGFYFFAIIIVGIIFKQLIISKVKKSDKEEKGKIAATADAIDAFISLPLIVTISLFVSVQALELPPSVEIGIKFLLYAVFSWYLMRFLFVFADYGLRKSRKTQADDHIIDFFRFIIRIIVVVIVVIFFLSNLGINVTSLIAGLGVLGLAIAFALQNVIADFFAAITIFLDRPFEIGDMIQIGSDKGRVEKIGIKSTQLRTLAGNMLIISNRELTNARIQNLKRVKKRRIDFRLGVDVDTAPDKLEAIPNILKRTINEIEGAKFGDAFFTEFGDFAFMFDVHYFINDPSITPFVKIKHQVNLAVVRTLEDEGIELPYPTQVVITKQQ